MSHHLNKIFDVWNGNAESMAADIGETGVTVRQWRNRGSIHSDHWPKIIKAADARGIVIRPEDFWPPDVVADLPVHHAASDGGADGEPSATKRAAIIGAAPDDDGQAIDSVLELTADDAADNLDDDICGVSADQGAARGDPFTATRSSAASRSTCSPTSAPPTMRAGSAACSAGSGASGR
jgi:hypothetical protein